MAVTSFKEILDGKAGSIGGPGESTITRAFRVISDNPFDTPNEIQPSLPIQWGDTLTGNSAFICRAIDYDFEAKGPGFLRVVVSFNFRTEEIDQEEHERAQNPNPLDRRARVVVRGIRYAELTVFDRDGNVKRNSAGEIYGEKEKDTERWVVNVKKNFSSIPDWAWDYQNTLNDAPVTVKGRLLAAETLKFGDILLPELKIENGHEFFPLEFDLEYRRKGWKDRRPDAGFYYLKDGEQTRIEVKQKDGTFAPAETEQWLDGNGGILRDTIANPQPGDEFTNEFEDYELADHSVLPLND